MKTNEITSRTGCIRDYTKIIDKCIKFIDEGNKTCTCDNPNKCYNKNCNIETINHMKKAINRDVETMYEAYYK